jgi:pSer/pThr/pTyr-binding forkhead associated (FHA) protein
MAFLLINDPITGKDRRISISTGMPFKIGRVPGNSLVIPENPQISKNHAQIRYGNGKFWIEDLDSRLGTTIDGTTVKTKILTDGMKIGLGTDFSCIFYHSASARRAGGGINDLDSETILDIPVNYKDFDESADEETGASGVQGAVLVQIDDNGDSLHTHLLNEPEMTAGRSDENHIVLDHKTISRTHCRITQKENNYFIQDLDSVNGIKINDAKVDYQVMNPGDRVQIGMLMFDFTIQGQEPTENQLKTKRKNLSELAPDSSGESDPRSSRLYWILGLCFLGISLLIYLLLT